MKRLNGMDAMLLYSETPNVHMHTLKIAIIDTSDFDRDFGIDLFRKVLEHRMYLLDPLRYQLINIPFSLHHPMWRENCAVDFDYHLRRVVIPSPGGRRELNQIIGEIASTPLDRHRPLWEVYFAEGLVGNRCALIFKVHHALADGVASANLLARVLDLEGSTGDEDHSYPTDPIPGTAELLRVAARDHLHHIAELPGLVKDAVGAAARLRRQSKQRGANPQLASAFNVPSTFINHTVSAQRTYATATVSLADIKQASKHFGITVNDMILSMTAGALRELLVRYDGQADNPLIATVPVSTDSSTERVAGNELGGLIISLPVHISDPRERVRLTALSAKIAKEQHQLIGPELPGRVISYLPPPLTSALLRRQAHTAAPARAMNVSVANVAGPRVHGHVGGAHVSEIYSVGPLIAGCGLNITVWSYVDQVNISALSDGETFRDTHEVTEAMVQAFIDIRRAAGLGADLTTVDTAMAPIGRNG